MLLPVLAEVKTIAPGDRLVAVEEGMFHTRDVFKNANGKLTLATGEVLKPTDSVLVLREVKHDTVVLTEKDIPDERDRSDLRDAEAARKRCERYGITEEEHPVLYWDVYYRSDSWQQQVAERGIELSEDDR